MDAASVRSRVFVDANQDEGTPEWGGPEANDGCPSRKKEREVWVKALGGDSEGRRAARTQAEAGSVLQQETPRLLEARESGARPGTDSPQGLLKEPALRCCDLGFWPPDQ